MIPISFFRSRAFAAGNMAIFTVLGSLFAEVYFFSQLLQNAMGYDALGAGLRLIPWTATFLVVGPIAGALTDRIGERPLMVSGLLIQAGASVWIALIASTDLAYSELVIPMVVAGSRHLDGPVRRHRTRCSGPCRRRRSARRPGRTP